MPRARVLADLTPLRESRDYRLLFSGQVSSYLGRQFTVVAVPIQVFAITHSSLAVGMVGLIASAWALSEPAARIFVALLLVQGAVLCADPALKWLAEQFGSADDIAWSLAGLPDRPDGSTAAQFYAQLPSHARLGIGNKSIPRPSVECARRNLENLLCRIR